MRRFVAVVPPPSVRAEVAAAVTGRGLLRAVRPEDPARWHVTLAFLGTTAEPSGLRPALADAAGRLPSPALRVSGAGCFGRRVLWAGVEGDLGLLADAVSDAVRGAGVPLDDRPFRAHLTLGRGRGGDLSASVAGLSGLRTSVWHPDRLLLLGSAAGSYRELASWPLSAGSAPPPAVGTPTAGAAGAEAPTTANGCGGAG